MEKLFGIPVDQLMVILLALFGLGVAIMGVVALRNRVILKVALRNIPRRRAQTSLIVLGLMLGTLLFSASFATGDTLAHTIKVVALERIGSVDVVVRAETPDPSGRPAYFDMAYFETVREHLSGVPEMEGVAPLARETAPVLVPSTRLSEPQVDILGYDEARMDRFDRLVDGHGNALSVSALAPGQVYVSSDLADKLDASSGDGVWLFLGAQPTALEVAGVYEKGANPAGELSMTMSLSRLQALTGNEGRINSILITNRGNVLQGAAHTDAVVSSLESLLEETGLEADPIKQDALDQAASTGTMFSTVFLVFGQFSIAAGILLIFLIFVMLAAERKRELGIARAVGAQRGHVIRMFAFEGAVYSLMAAAVGSLLGVAVGWGMVRIMAIAFGQMEFGLVFAFSWQSVVIAYTLGMVLTFAVVLVSSWRVSRLNIVRAIRDIPEPRITRRTMRGLVLNVLLPVVGILFTIAGIGGERASLFMLGTSLLIIGVSLLALRLGLPERPAYTVAGVGLVVWWLLPFDALDFILPEMQAGIEMFFISGIMIVLGAVWAVIYNSDLVLAATVFLFGRVRGLAPVLKIAVSYPMQSKLRTGMTLAMFSLVVFTLIVMAFIIHSFAAVFEDTERLSGGFHIRAETGYANPIPDIQAAIQEADGLSLDDFQAIGSFNGMPVKLKQADTEQEPTDFYLQGVDSGYTDSVTYKFAMMAEGYDSPREVWQALQEESGMVVVSSVLVPVKESYDVGGPHLDFRLEGFWLEDKTLPEVYILAQDPRSGNEERLRVIGVVEQTAIYTGLAMTSQDTLKGLLS